VRSYCKAKPAAGYERKIVGNGLDRSVGFGLLVFCLVISLVSERSRPFPTEYPNIPANFSGAHNQKLLTHPS
jgi:hypothetical protein